MDRLPDLTASDSLRLERALELERFELIEDVEIRGDDVALSGDRVGLIIEGDEGREALVVEFVERLGADV